MRDKDVRKAVRNSLAQDHLGDVSTRIVEEMGIWAGSVRIDIAVINGELSGFELKSARDNLNRLPVQQEIYSKVFDKMTIVVACNHLKDCLDIIPRWWGVTVAEPAEEEGLILSKIRLSEGNPSLDPLFLARLLWRQEALLCLEGHGLAKGYRSKSVGILHERLAVELPVNLLQEYVRDTLKRRECWLR